MQSISAFIVEDDQSAHDLFAKIFDYIGISATSLYDGDDALDYLEQNSPDLALIDMHLPGANGIELLKYIRTQDHLKDMIAIITSSDDAAKTLSRDLADYVVLKPINNQNLIDLIQSIFNNPVS